MTIPDPWADSSAVPRLMKFAALLLAVLWQPATLHCKIEQLGLDVLFACPAESVAHTDGAACADDACVTLETGQFALANSRVDFSASPLLFTAAFFCILALAPPALAPEIAPVRQDVTLPLQRTWQFARRAALPARAPSLLG